ncbi:putative hydroxypyruvate isomerase isoform X4 [Arvicanthis niloticus]|uniref:putative hydroxypyruvate isomerase isoform X4 n=1 Tax=Arvicanthis niloticus TaxID=61156 RepID=UPI00402BD8F1
MGKKSGDRKHYIIAIKNLKRVGDSPPALPALPEDSSLVPSTYKVASSRRSDALFWPPQALHECGALTYKIHLMAGRVPRGAARAAVKGEMEMVFVENLRHAAGVLAQENLVGLLEPINTRITDPQYFLDTPQQAAAILQKVGRPNLQLQMDIFHWQIMDGNLTGNVREFLPIVGHVQVAQVPDRGEPGSSGELDFTYLFQLLEDEGYQGFVGCEYRPRGDTVEGLSWLRSYWDRRGHPRTGQ